MAEVIYTPRNYIQIYDQWEQFLVGSGVGLTNFNVGSRLRALGEGFSLVSGQTHFQFYQSLIAAIPTSLYDALGFTRLPGVKAAGQIKIGLNEAPLVNTTVPAGLTLNINGNDYTTTTASVILAGQTESAAVTLQANQFGVIQNLSIGDVDTRDAKGFFSAENGFDYAYNTTAISGGTDQETDEDRRLRFITYVNGLTKTTLVGIQAGLLAIGSVRSVYIRELFPENGWITIYVDDGSGSLPPALLTEVNKVVYGDPNDVANYPGYKAAGIHVSVEAPVLRLFDITDHLDIDQATLANPADIVIAAETAMSTYLDSLKLGQDVIITEIITAVQNAHPDIIDVQITALAVDGNPIPVANFTIASNELSKANSFATTFDLIPRS